MCSGHAVRSEAATDCLGQSARHKRKLWPCVLQPYITGRNPEGSFAGTVEKARHPQELHNYLCFRRAKLERPLTIRSRRTAPPPLNSSVRTHMTLSTPPTPPDLMQRLGPLRFGLLAFCVAALGVLLGFVATLAQIRWLFPIGFIMALVGVMGGFSAVIAGWVDAFTRHRNN